MMRSVRILVIAIATTVIVGAGFYFSQPFTAAEKASANSVIGGPFVLTSARGGVVDSTRLAGKPYGVFFGYTHCPEVCPTTLAAMSGLLADLGDKAQDFHLFFITVDPARDTPPVMKDYIANFDPRIDALVPTIDELAKVAKQFRVIYEEVPAENGDYTMNHTATLYLMNRRGEFVSTIAYDETAQGRRAKLEKLLAAK